jgi:hypothetical protein
MRFIFGIDDPGILLIALHDLVQVVSGHIVQNQNFQGNVLDQGRVDGQTDESGAVVHRDHNGNQGRIHKVASYVFRI